MAQVMVGVRYLNIQDGHAYTNTVKLNPGEQCPVDHQNQDVRTHSVRTCESTLIEPPSPAELTLLTV